MKLSVAEKDMFKVGVAVGSIVGFLFGWFLFYGLLRLMMKFA